MKKIFSFFAAMLVAVAANASTDFAAPGYYCAADDALITGDAPSNKVYLDESADPHHIAWSDVSKTYTAVIKWTVAATRACYISVSLELGPTISSNKHIFEVKVLDANGAEVGALEEGPAYTGDGFTDANTVKALTGKIMIPAAGDYTVELRNNRDYCKGSIKNVILTYAGAAPITDFAAPGYSCTADDATLSGTVSSSFGLNTDGDDHYVFWSDRALSSPAAASWSIIATRACYITASLDLGPVISSNKHIFEVKVLDEQGEEVGTAAEPGESTEANQVKALTQQILIPEAGSYTIELRNNRDWGKGAVKNVILAYAADAPAEEESQELYLKISSDWSYPAKYAIYYFNDGANGWSDFMTLVEGEDDTYVGSIPADFADDNIIFVRLNGEATTPNWNDKWSQTVNLTIPEGKDFFTVVSGGTGDQCNGTWSKYGEAPAEPEIPYMAIIGDMNNWAGDELVPAEDKLTASATIHLDMNDNSGYGFKVLIGDKAYCIEPTESWYSFHRGWTTASGIDHVATENEAFWLQIDMEGDYVFTWTLADKKLEITFPEKEEVAENPWESWFTGVDNWGGETQSTLTWDAENEKATINIALDKNAQWKAQAKYHGIATQKEHFYHVALKMKANHDLGGVTLKWENNSGLIYKNQSITLTANTEYAFEEESIMAREEGGDGVLVLDFGYAKAGDIIEVYDLVIEEIDAPVVDLEDGYYIIGLNGWSIYDLTDDYLFAANIENEGEYVLEDVTLAENAEFKVVAVANNALGNWYPAEAGNYKVTANQAGVRDIYFRPDYQGGEGWHAGCIYVYVENIEPQDPVQYCEKPSGHQNDPNFGDANGRILLTIAKADGNNVIVKIKNNNEAGNTKTGLNYLWVNAQGSTGVVRYGNGSHSEADVEEVSVIVEFAEPQTSYNFVNIHWAYSGWEGEWALDGLTVAADELCDDESGTGTAISNTTVADKAVKVIENGKLYIILNGVRYNAQGQME